LDYDANLLIEEREQLKIQRDGHTETKKSDNSIVYYDMKCIKKDIERISQTTDYNKFVINYLLYTYGVRNKDLNVFITNDKNKLNSTDNFLFVGSKSVKWIINDYKTKATYGTKEITIKNPNFLRVMNLIPNNSYLLSYEGKRIENSSLDRFIKTRTLHNLSEGEVFKNILHHNRNKNNLEDVKKQFSKDTINQYYMTN
jgi:hypothetical protein